MRDTRVEEVEQISSDSDSDETDAVGMALSAGGGASAGPASLDSSADCGGALTPTKQHQQPTVGIFPNHVQQGPTYLIFATQEEKEKWLYHLTVVSGGNPKQGGTHFEQLLQKLMEADGDPACAAWKNATMLYTKDSIASPLTTFTDERLQAESLKLFKVFGCLTC